MSEDWTDEIRERLEKATPGPWHVSYEQKNETWPGNFRLEEGLPLGYGGGGEEGIYADNPSDFQFIAHAPTDISNLLQEREILREALRKYLHLEMRFNTIMGPQRGEKSYFDTGFFNPAKEALAWKPEDNISVEEFLKKINEPTLTPTSSKSESDSPSPDKETLTY